MLLQLIFFVVGIPVIPCLATNLEKAIEKVFTIDSVSYNLDIILEEFKQHLKDGTRSDQWLSKYNDISDLKEKIDKGTIGCEPEIANVVNQFIDCVNPVKVGFNFFAIILKV